MFRCCELVLPERAGIRREIRRATELRTPDFEAQFDTLTLFYDLFPAEREYGEQMVLVAPPLWNLAPTLLKAGLERCRIQQLVDRYFLRGRSSDLWLRCGPDALQRLTFSFGSFELKPQRAEHHLFESKRVLYTLSKNNEVSWIVDWIAFHRHHHGLDAVLLYDNGSELYDGGSLEARLRAAFPSVEIHVVHWPYKYGPSGMGKEHWDSDFSQTGAFQDARFRFLSRAKSVLNCDVDELVVSETGGSVFEEAERSGEGCVFFDGYWISTATVHTESQQRRHRDFVFLEQAPAGPKKWCAVPEQCRRENSWGPHSIWGKDEAAGTAPHLSYRHFRGINTDWKYRRSSRSAVDPARHRLDTTLQTAFADVKDPT